MSEKSKETQQGKKSVPGVGLSKKERRALKVAEKDGPQKSNNTHQLTQAESSKINKEKLNKKVENVLPTPTKSKTPIDKKLDVDITSETRESKATQNDMISSITSNKENDSTDSTGPSKAQLKAERRSIQEKQRQAKGTIVPVINPSTTTSAALKPTEAKPKAPTQSHAISSTHRHQVPLFNHLYNDSCQTTYGISSNVIISPAGVHPAFIRLGVQCATRTVIGSNARCIALLETLKQLVVDHVTPPKQDFCRSLEQAVQTCVDYLQNNSRKLSVSMSNAVHHFKLRLTQIDTNLDDSEKQSQLVALIDNFLIDDIGKAGEAISISVQDKIKVGDVVLTYGSSSLIQRILLDAHSKKPSSFHCIIVDSRPLLEGRHTLRILCAAGISCTYTLINGVCSIIDRATKVLLGAHALLANGSVMARTGTAQVAMVACRCNKPVMVCCETYKFCERAQVDSYVYNELGDPHALANIDTQPDYVGDTPLRKWVDIPCLTPLNLMYDVTPPDYVTVVVTELGMLPCTSVPVILRVKQTDIS